ncbi:MAG: DMT family transporter [Alphaproteobacteria bacterium]|nr:DMT family transporter [Alphaproteobacteria bacterium]
MTYLLLIVPPLMWAGNAVISRAVLAGGGMPPMALSLWRWVLAAAILVLLTRGDLIREWPKVKRQLPFLVFMALASVSAYNTMLYQALTSTTAINAMIVASSLPLVTILLSWLWLGERPKPLALAGLALSFAGLLAVIGRGDLAVLAAFSFEPGDLWVLAATLSWGVYSVALRRYPTGIKPLVLLTWLVLIGTPFLLPLHLAELAGGMAPALTWANLGAVIYVAACASVLAYICWNEGVMRLGAGLAGQFTYLTPLFAALLAVFFLGESFQLYHAAGLGLIFAGIGLASLKSSR